MIITLGVEAVVYLTEIDWEKDLDTVGALIDNLRKESDIIASVDDWYDDILESRENECKEYSENFNSLLTCFLFSSTKGFSVQTDFDYKDKKEITCGEPAPEILLGNR